MPKKIPLRTCMGCREMLPKAELLRIVKSPQGVVTLDKTGKAQGRGGYICLSSTCLAKARKTKTLERALEIAIDAGVYDQLEVEIGRREL